MHWRVSRRRLAPLQGARAKMCTSGRGIHKDTPAAQLLDVLLQLAERGLPNLLALHLTYGVQLRHVGRALVLGVHLLPLRFQTIYEPLPLIIGELAHLRLPCFLLL